MSALHGVPLLASMRNRHLLIADVLLVPMAAVLAFALRLDSAQLQTYVSTMLIYALAAPLIQIPIFAALGIYSRFWRYASIDELLLLAWAALIGGLAQGALFLGIQAFFPDLLNPGVPRSIPLDRHPPHVGVHRGTAPCPAALVAEQPALDQGRHSSARCAARADRRRRGGRRR